MFRDLQLPDQCVVFSGFGALRESGFGTSFAFLDVPTYLLKADIYIYIYIYIRIYIYIYIYTYMYTLMHTI